MSCAPITPDAPEGWVGLDRAAKILGVGRRTVLHKVQRGGLRAVQVTEGRRKGLRIEVSSARPGLFETTR